MVTDKMTKAGNFADWSVAIPVFNAFDVVSRTLDCLLDSDVEGARILFLDDGSTDPNWVSFRDRAESAGCRYLRHETNQGYTVNINRAFVDPSKYVLLLNSDCLIQRSEILQLVKTADTYPMLAGVGPLSNLAGSQSVAIAARRSWLDLTNIEIAEAVKFLTPRLAWKFGRRPFIVPSVNGFCTLWRTEAVREVGAFDAVNFTRGYGEEDDLCFRLLEQGWLCAVAPWVLAIHFKTQSFSAAERNARKPLAMAVLERIYGRRFVGTVIEHFDSHPLFRQLTTAPADA